MFTILYIQASPAPQFLVLSLLRRVRKFKTQNPWGYCICPTLELSKQHQLISKQHIILRGNSWDLFMSLNVPCIVIWRIAEATQENRRHILIREELCRLCMLYMHECWWSFLSSLQRQWSAGWTRSHLRKNKVAGAKRSQEVSHIYPLNQHK